MTPTAARECIRRLDERTEDLERQIAATRAEQDWRDERLALAEQREARTTARAILGSLGVAARPVAPQPLPTVARPPSRESALSAQLRPAVTMAAPVALMGGGDRAPTRREAQQIAHAIISGLHLTDADPDVIPLTV